MADQRRSSPSEDVQRLYEEASRADSDVGAGPGASGADEASDDEVVDAEIVDDKH